MIQADKGKRTQLKTYRRICLCKVESTLQYRLAFNIRKQATILKRIT